LGAIILPSSSDAALWEPWSTVFFTSGGVAPPATPNKLENIVSYCSALVLCERNESVILKNYDGLALSYLQLEHSSSSSSNNNTKMNDNYIIDVRNRVHFLLSCV
jgi:hypothetical protein